MKTVFVLVCILNLASISNLLGQELYSIHPINSESYSEKNGYYFPEHDIKIEKGSEVLNNATPLFNPKLNGYFQYIYEIFEDFNKEKFLIISAIPRKEDIGGYANFSMIKRGLFYVVPISNPGLVYYGDFNSSTLNKKRETIYYSFGNFIHSINIEESFLRLMSVKDKEEKTIDIKLFIYENNPVRQ